MSAEPVLDELRWHRTALCDVLLGRWLRGAMAQVIFERALLLEHLGAPRRVVDDELDNAAHAEWIATITEKGTVVWGGRHNRCGDPEPESFDG